MKKIAIYITFNKTVDKLTEYNKVQIQKALTESNIINVDKDTVKNITFKVLK